jgi:hypothetical protein
MGDAVKKTGLGILIWLAAAGPAWGLEPGLVIDHLDRLIERGADEQTLFNYGYQLWCEHGPLKENAAALAEGYRDAARARRDVAALARGAYHWQLKHQYWGRPIPRTINTDPDERDLYWWLLTGRWETNLKLYRPGDQRFRPKRPFNPRGGDHGRGGLRLTPPGQ